MQRGVVWNKHDRAIESVERCDVFAELLEKDGKQAACCSMRGLLRDQLAQRSDGFGNASGMRQTQCGVHRCVSRLR